MVAVAVAITVAVVVAAVVFTVAVSVVVVVEVTVEVVVVVVVVLSVTTVSVVVVVVVAVVVVVVVVVAVAVAVSVMVTGMVEVMEGVEHCMMMINVRELRMSKGISTHQIISLLGLKTLQAYYKKELGYNRFTLEEAKKISKLLDVPIEDINFMGKGE